MQITPDKTYVVLTGWHRQQCVMVEPHITVADLKNYLHQREPARMPMEACTPIACLLCLAFSFLPTYQPIRPPTLPPYLPPSSLSPSLPLSVLPSSFPLSPSRSLSLAPASLHLPLPLPPAHPTTTLAQALDIGVRRGDDIKILDDNLTMQRVWDIAATGDLFGGSHQP